MKHSTKVLLFSSSAVLVVVLLILAFIALPYLHANSSPQNQCGSWAIDQGPALTSPGGIDVSAVVAVAPQDIWEVGTDNYHTLVEHWNGKQWSVVSSPNNGTGRNQLNAISAVSTNDVWAVGYATPDRDKVGQTQTLIEHWNGQAWTIVPGAILSSPNAYLQGIVALSAQNIWAVGNAVDTDPAAEGSPKTLIEHWNGQAWQVVSSPNPGVAADTLRLYGITAVSPDDIWAVGDHANSLETADYTTLVEHWNGQTWQVVPGANTVDPHGTMTQNHLTKVAALSTNDAWAVGYASDTRGGHTLIEHWNGQTWQVIAHPDPAASSNGAYLFGIAAFSSTNIWAVGYMYGSGPSHIETIVDHWNGKQWSIANGPNPDSQSSQFPQSNQLNDVAALAPDQIIAVGTTRLHTSFEPLMARMAKMC